MVEIYTSTEKAFERLLMRRCECQIRVAVGISVVFANPSQVGILPYFSSVDSFER